MLLILKLFSELEKKALQDSEATVTEVNKIKFHSQKAMTQTVILCI